MPKFGDAKEYNGGAGEDQLAFVTAVLGNGNVNLLYKEDGGGWEAAADVPYRGAADRKKDGGGHTFHDHGD